MIALMRRIINVSGKYKGRIKLAFVFSFLKSMASKFPLCLAFVMISAFLDRSITKQMCIWLGIGVLISLILQVIFQNIADRLQSAAGFMVFADKRMNLGEHLRKMPMGYFTEGNIGKISSVLSSDMVFIEENAMTVIADMMSYVFSEVIMIVFLFYLNPFLGMAGVAMLILYAVVGKGLEKEALEDSKNRQEQSEKLTDAVLDFAEGIGIIKTYNLLGEKSKELSNNFKKMCETSLNFERAHAPWARANNLVYGLASAVLLGVSLLLYTNGRMEASFLVGMILFTFDIFGPMKALYGNATRLTVMNSCLDRMESVFSEEELSDKGKKHISKVDKAPVIEFRNVNFGYGEKKVLHNISFQVNKNHMTALVGTSGGGKSTVANLLARFWDITSGEILVNGTNIKEIPLAELMNDISMVFQRVYLFQDTIYNNISMGRPDATREEVIEAAKKARCYEFIRKLPEGFDTVVGEGGASLSGGECQRISIARCILKDAPIVILDEATASVDADNESYIQEAISELCKGKTLLVIAHKLNTIRNADEILVISEGRIVQRGVHEELIKKDGIYRRFVTTRQNSKGWNTRKKFNIVNA
ncbi:transport ATP-binding protein CydC [Lachnospiraceae bacterium KM106-2]|nr:transport ATP-binding protein CydC [Lachnospiraceae bacterium KM106-2]